MEPLKCTGLDADGKNCKGHMVLEDYSRNGESWDQNTRRNVFIPPELQYSCSKAPKCKETQVLREHRREK